MNKSTVIAKVIDALEEDFAGGVFTKFQCGLDLNAHTILVMKKSADDRLVSVTEIFKFNQNQYKDLDALYAEARKRNTIAREIFAYFNEFGSLKPEWLATGNRHKGSAATQSERDSWATPDWLFRFFDKHYGPFTLDAAASADNAKCAEFLTREQDGRNTALWQGHSAVWINPPFSGVQEWLESAFNYAHASENTVCVVVPDDISTGWFQYAATHAAEMYGLISGEGRTGRVGFINSKTGKPVTGNNKGTFVFVFRKRKRQLVTRWYSRFDMENLF